MAACGATEPDEAMSEDPALEETAQFALDEAGRRPVAFGRLNQECLQVFADDLVEDGLLRATGFVRGAR